jgi:hypothetical protein
MISKALDACFPILESLELRHESLTETQGFTFPSTFLTTSTQSLRELKFLNLSFTSLLPLLSVITTLVDLTLRIGPLLSPPSIISLLNVLESFPCLRHLDLSILPFGPASIPPKPAPPVKTHHIVSLAKLTYFRLKGQTVPVEELLAGMTTPSIRELQVSLHHFYVGFHTPHLYKFIRNAKSRFFAAQVRIDSMLCAVSLLPQSHFIGVPLLTIIMFDGLSIAQIGSMLSEMLATVEDVFIGPFLATMDRSSYGVDVYPYLGFVGRLRSAKILRVRHGLQTVVASMFQDNNGKSRMGLLPSLERIEVHKGLPDEIIRESDRESGLNPFEALVTARRQAGRLVDVSWNMDQVYPATIRGWNDEW